MAFTLNIPTITELAGAFFSMKIYEQGNENNRLKCVIMDLMETNAYATPKEPIDSGEYIGDTLYRMPLSIACRVFVNTNFLDSFNSSIDKLQKGAGFCITGADGQIYENMRIESITSSQTAEVQGGYFFNIVFSEVILVESFSAGLGLNKVQKSAYSSKQDSGEQANNRARKQSILFGFTN